MPLFVLTSVTALPLFSMQEVVEGWNGFELSNENLFINVKELDAFLRMRCTVICAGLIWIQQMYASYGST